MSKTIRQRGLYALNRIPPAIHTQLLKYEEKGRNYELKRNNVKNLNLHKLGGYISTIIECISGGFEDTKSLGCDISTSKINLTPEALTIYKQGYESLRNMGFD
jgi:hypothetical protein